MARSRREMHCETARQNYLLMPQPQERISKGISRKRCQVIKRTAGMILFILSSAAGHAKRHVICPPDPSHIHLSRGNSPLPGLRFCPPARTRVIISKRKLGYAVLHPKSSPGPPSPSESTQPTCPARSSSHHLSCPLLGSTRSSHSEPVLSQTGQAG